MFPLTGESLLRAWELGANRDEWERPLVLLRLACPELGEDPASVGIPELMVRLLKLRQISFGSSLSGYVPCPACSTRLEFSLSIPALLKDIENFAFRDPVVWSDGPFAYKMRPLNSRELAASCHASDYDTARRLLLESCTACSESGKTVPLPSPTNPQLLEKFNELHAAAEIVLDLACPACGKEEGLDLDLSRFLWMEVRHHALRLLREVHELAATYGWAENAILAMTGQRRRAYLEMVRS